MQATRSTYLRLRPRHTGGAGEHGPVRLRHGRAGRLSARPSGDSTAERVLRCQARRPGLTESVRCELLHDKSAVPITMVRMPAVNTPQFTWLRTHLPRHAQPVPPIYQPEVALTLLAKAVVPGLLDRYLARTGFDSQQTDVHPRPRGMATSSRRRTRRRTTGRTACSTTRRTPSTRRCGRAVITWARRSPLRVSSARVTRCCAAGAGAESPAGQWFRALPGVPADALSLPRFVAVAGNRHPVAVKPAAGHLPVPGRPACQDVEDIVSDDQVRLFVLNDRDGGGGAVSEAKARPACRLGLNQHQGGRGPSQAASPPGRSVGIRYTETSRRSTTGRSWNARPCGAVSVTCSLRRCRADRRRGGRGGGGCRAAFPGPWP